MTTSGVYPQVLLERIQTLEAQNRRWRLASLLAFLLLAASLAKGLMAQGLQAPQTRMQTIEAQSFLLRDSNGNMRGQLSMKENKPSLDLYDAAGKVIWSTSAGARLLPAH